MSRRDGQCRCAWHGVTIWHVRRRVNVHLIDHADALMRRWLLLLVLGAVGCEKPPAPEASPREAASAPRDTSPKPALVPAPQAVDTTSARVSLTIPQACEAFAAIFTASAAANGIASSEVGVPRDTAMSFGETRPEQLEAGCRVAGVTVHQVTAELDHGPILDQAVVPVLPGDTEVLLATRVLSQEHLLYPRAIAGWLAARR